MEDERREKKESDIALLFYSVFSLFFCHSFLFLSYSFSLFLSVLVEGWQIGSAWNAWSVGECSDCGVEVLEG